MAVNNESDYNITKSYKTGKESIPRHIKEIKRRLKDFGFIGYVDYLDKKLVNVWCVMVVIFLILH